MAVELFAALILGASAGLLVQQLGASRNLERAAPLLLNAAVLALVLAAGVEAGARLAASSVDVYSILYYSTAPGLASAAVYALYRRIRG